MSEPEQFVANVEPRKDWPNSAGPWCLVHVPTGQKVPTDRVLPDGRHFYGYAFKRKRDAQDALQALRAAARDAAKDPA